MDTITLILLILVIMIIITIIALGALYYTGHLNLNIGPTGAIGLQGIPGTASNTGATGSGGLGDFAFVSLTQKDDTIVVQSISPVPFNHAVVHGGISYDPVFNRVVMGPIGYYQISFGYGNIMPGTFVPQSFSIVPNSMPPSDFLTLQEQINVTTDPPLRFDRGGQSATVLYQTTRPNEFIQLMNTLTSPVTFRNETTPVTYNNVGSLSAYIMVIRLF